MTDIVLFHHIQGLTEGLRAIADDWRAAGHTVHTPDLFAGQLPASIDAGFALKEEIGEEVIQRRIADAIAPLPAEVVYAGFSWGVMTAQRLAQTRPGARGAILFEACIPITGDWAFGPWPDGVAVQIHGKDHDPFFAGEGDIDAARELVAHVGPELGELFTYPGDQHLFADRSLSSYDASAAGLALERSRAFLDRLS
jgi:dienelactone hydrolase